MKVERINENVVNPGAGPRIGNGLEVAFLGEMLKLTLPSPDGVFSGGIGESQFGSFLTEQYAGAMANRLDLGLAEKGGSRG